MYKMDKLWGRGGGCASLLNHSLYYDDDRIIGEQTNYLTFYNKLIFKASLGSRIC